MRWLLRVLLMAWDGFVRSVKASGAIEEKERNQAAVKDKLDRQDKVAAEPIDREKLDKSLRDGTF